jgi:hypothetical protein
VQRGAVARARRREGRADRAQTAPDAYKTVCTHYIQSSAAPVIRRLGLAERIEACGANRNTIDVWTPYGGWIRPPGGAPHGYNVTRLTLDPLLRELATSTPGVAARRASSGHGCWRGWSAPERSPPNR